MPRTVRAACLLLSAAVVVGACTLDRAELYEAGGVVPSAIDDLRVLTYRDDPATHDWVDVVTPDPAVLEEGDAFREENSRTAAEDEVADARRSFTRVGEGRSLLVQLDRASGDLQVWEFVDEADDAGDPVGGTGIANEGQTNEVVDGGYLTIVRPADAGDAAVEIIGDDDVSVTLVGAHTPEDGVAIRIDVYAVSGLGRVTVAYGDGEDVTTYDVVAT
ncbi:MAG: hypothetical protein OSA99_10395 [Acidimicrobiales bacterium]|nr:hypothetical protein [Acidimicrobiales bacterium]